MIAHEPDHAHLRDALLSSGWDLLWSTCLDVKMSTCTQYEDMKGDAKYRKWGGFRRLWVTRGHRLCHHLNDHIRLPIRVYSWLCMHLHRSRFLNVASYLSRVAEFNPHQLHFPTCENENDPVPFHHITHTGIKHCASYMAGTLLTCRSKCSDNIALYVCSVWSKSTLLCTASSLWLVSEV